MRVLTVVMMADARRGGGLAERAYQLTRAYARAGGPEVSTELLTLDLDLTDARIAPLAPATLTPMPCANRRFYLPARPGQVAERVAAADVVHLLGHWTALGALGFRAARRHGVPWVVSPCGSLPVAGRSRAAKRAYNVAVGTRIVRDAAAAIAVTADEAADFARYGRDPAAVRVIPNGVAAADHDRDAGGAFLRRHGLAGRRYVLFLGRLNRIKGVDLLIEAFAAAGAAADGWLLVLAGPDEGLAAELRAQASALGVAAAVRFVGVVAGAERTEALRAASLLVVPSRREAMSIVALEAGVNSTPVLITDVCGFDEVARCRGGLVVEATAPALAAGLRQLLARPDALAEHGTRLRALVLAEFTWERAAARHLEVFADVVPAVSAGTELAGRGTRGCE
ncbi:glycosyltransferase [Pseudofrankia inefficax]|uniref:Glycosyl transferase group 1 n=1 Tax=Pseudofrankia inefficax (strain DSM 45817 / CECT 9037 / DDB 130130 / EuI1c) TaxID=298654 RepID=E3IZ07_PSEI1|nr:glycosyltransferase [Pseudofrankia inefficax]ADP80290.1 glycosyl transferase group 1 [Pseudofrankia inefficax]